MDFLLMELYLFFEDLPLFIVFLSFNFARDFLEMDLDLFLELEDSANLPLASLTNIPEALSLLIDLFLIPEDIFFEEVPLFGDVDLRGIRFPFTVIDGMRVLGLDLNWIEK